MSAKPAAPRPAKNIRAAGSPVRQPGTPVARLKPRPPQQSAVALAYRNGAAAPQVVAKGSGLIADQIIARAQEHGVFVHESKELVALLMNVDLDRQIPPALYRAIAELLAWLYHIESRQNNSVPMPPAPDVAAHLPGLPIPDHRNK
jgi:flagellar biosynthesis protein